MPSCTDYRNLLLDHLYGLLDDAEAVALRAHLADCPECQAALTAAERQQQLLARAAQVYTQVPLFQAPADEKPAAPAASTAPVTLPMPVRARRPVRRWLGVAAAAAAVVLAVWVWRQYEQGLHQHEADLAKLRR